jgi:hypothetical protein
MKKHILFALTLFICTQFFAQNDQISNGGFENWSQDTLFDYTTEWICSNTEQFYGIPTTIQSTDAYTGDYAAELRTVQVGGPGDIAFGFVYHGIYTPAGNFGGIPYTDVFNEVRFQYKSNLNTGDTLYAIIIRFAVGTILDISVVPAATTSQNNWTQASVIVPSGVQNQIYVGFMLADPINGYVSNPGAWARIDDVQLYNVGSPAAAIPDPSFELWASETMEAADDWYTLNNYLVTAGLENAVKTTDANTGNYALQLSTIQDAQSLDTIAGIASIGAIDFSIPSNPFVPIPYNLIPTTISGAYKYNAANGDQAVIQLIFLQQGNPIGSHIETLNASSSYTNFTSPLTIAGTPDSIILVVVSGDNPGSVLKLDDLRFSGGGVGIEEFEKFEVSIYPNPASDIVMIKSEGVYSYEIIDLTGKIVRSAVNNIGALSINISDISSGSYLVKLNNANGIQIHQLLVE